MSKRRYRCVEIKQVDWSALAQRVDGGRVVVAIDVAKQDMVAALMTADATVLARLRWVHPQQTPTLLEGLDRLARSASLEAVLEPSGTYADALIGQLRRHAVAVYRIAPKRVHDAAELYDGVPSLHDAKAAEVIGRLHLDGVSTVWVAARAERRELQAKTTRLAVCKARHQAALNRLEAALSRHWPELLTVLELDTATVSTLVSTYGDAAAVATDPGGAQALMRRVGGRWLAEEKIAAVLADARASLGLPTVPGERDLLKWLAGDVETIRRERRAAERAIEQQVAQTATLAPLGAVVGRVSAAVLVAALGDPRDYPDSAGYLKALGLNLKERSSGTHRGQLKITKRGPGVARTYLYFAALRLIAREPVVGRWYRRRTDHPGAIKGKSIVALMRKLARALWSVARGDAFAVERLFNRAAPAA
jgi:transposase